MDGKRFDEITRGLAKGANRRGVLKGLAGAIAGLAGLSKAVDVGAACRPGGGYCTRHTDCCTGKCFEAARTGVQRVCCTAEAASVTCAGRVCGTAVNNCGQTISCGTCPLNDQNPCTGTATCSAAGQCVYPPLTNGTDCGDCKTCQGGTCTYLCTGDQTCCNDTCRFSTGHTCTADSQCCDGFCTDGVCCKTRCDGACERCNVADNLGSCTSTCTGTDFCCNDTCCEQADTCCGGACCDGPCDRGVAGPQDDICCTTGGAFCGLGAHGDQCCPADTATVQYKCCGTAGCCQGQCYEEADDDDACCEQTTDFLCDGACCPNANNCCGGEICCLPGRCNDKSQCCASNEFACGDNCCDTTSQKCCGGQCVALDQDGNGDCGDCETCRLGECVVLPNETTCDGGICCSGACVDETSCSCEPNCDCTDPANEGQTCNGYAIGEAVCFQGYCVFFTDICGENICAGSDECEECVGGECVLINQCGPCGDPAGSGVCNGEWCYTLDGSVPLPNAAACTDNADCCSGNCCDNVCVAADATCCATPCGTDCCSADELCDDSNSDPAFHVCYDSCSYRCGVWGDPVNRDCGNTCPDVPNGGGPQFCMNLVDGFCCPGTGLGTDANCAYCGDVCTGGNTCQAGVCAPPVCVPSVTCAAYTGGQCGTGFSDGCTSTLSCPCPSGQTCNNSPQGFCVLQDGQPCSGEGVNFACEHYACTAGVCTTCLGNGQAGCSSFPNLPCCSGACISGICQIG